MTLLPVIERELRAESRSAFTYWLRVIGAAALLAAAVFLFFEDGLAYQSGKRVFAVLQLTLLTGIGVIVPLMTADCISREKREGTLGLLFLTPLRAFEVVLAKGLAHGLRALALCLAALPVLVIPFLLGGVGWKEALVALMICISAFCLALGAGLLASAWQKSTTASMVVGIGMTALAGVVFFVLLGLLPMTFLALTTNAPSNPFDLEDIAEVALYLLLDSSEVFQGFARWGSGSGVGLVFLAVGLVTFSAVLLLALMILLAALGVRIHAHERPRSEIRNKLENQFCTPKLGVRLFRRWMRRLLERNPMGWLERRTWQSRLVMWSWLTLLVVIYSFAAPGAVYGRNAMDEMHITFGWVLVGNIALCACMSLRRERETGVMELLLVTPLKPAQIIMGRLRGVWGQFLPIALLLFGLWLWLAYDAAYFYYGSFKEKLIWISYFLVTLLTLPVVGLFFSMHCRMLVTALLFTATVGVGVPWMLLACAATLASNCPGGIPPIGWMVAGAMAPAVGGLCLIFWGLNGLGNLSFVLGVLLGLIGIGSMVVCRVSETGSNLDTLFITQTLFASQLAIAVGCAAGLRRLLEQRRFALPR